MSLALLSRMLEPADFGIVAAALVVAGLSAVLSELGVNAAIVQAEELTPELEVSAFLLSICMAIALFLLVQLNAAAIAGLFVIPELEAVLPYIAFGFLLRGLAQVSEGKVNRRMDFRLPAFIETSSYVLGYAVVGPLAALQGLGYWSLILAYLAQTSVATIALMVQSPPCLVTLPSRQALKQAFLFGNGITLGRMFSYFAGSGDNFVAALDQRRGAGSLRSRLPDIGHASCPDRAGCSPSHVPCLLGAARQQGCDGFGLHDHDSRLLDDPVSIAGFSYPIRRRGRLRAARIWLGRNGQRPSAIVHYTLLPHRLQNQ
ncbi:oligosaccharide flippase family protein [Devosia sp. A8/3-2]|nr:oligosaccharide flippase family protein [Devosia sp. A8/3-2]